MIKKLLLVPLAFFAGIFIYMQTHGISMVTQITNLPNTLGNLIQPATTFLTNNPLASLIGGGGITVIGILARQFQNMKAKATTAIQTAQAWKSETFQINAVTNKLQDELKEKQTEVNTLKDQVTNLLGQYTQQITDLTSKVTDLEKRNEDLQNQYNLAVRTLAEKAKIPETKKSVA